jgi:hypothetical protein
MKFSFISLYKNKIKKKRIAKNKNLAAIIKFFVLLKKQRK